MAFGYSPEMILRIQTVLLNSVDEDAAVDLFRSVNQNFENLKLSGETFPRSFGHALTTASQGGWLLPFLLKAAERVPNDDDLRELVAELTIHTQRADVDHFELCRLDGNFHFIDRKPVRDSMRLLNRPDRQRIMIVTGPEQSGKSYSLRLLYHLETHLRSFRLVEVDLSELTRLAGPNQVLQPDHVAQELVDRLGYFDLAVDPPPDDQQWARWILRFCKRLEDRGQPDPNRYWIVFDAFNKVVLTQPVADLVKELAKRVGGRLATFRLILIGYGDQLPTTITPTVQPVHLELISPENLVEFFINYLRESEFDGTPDELADLVDDAVEAVLSGLTPDDNGYLSRLFKAVDEQLPRLLEPST